MKKHKSKIIAGVIIAIVLAFVFWYGGDASSPRSSESQTIEVSESDVSAPTDLPDLAEAPARATDKEQKDTSADSDAEEREPASDGNGNGTSSVQTEMVIDSSTGKEKYNTDPVPDGKPLPEEPQDAVISDKEYTCTLSVRCDTILKNLTKLDKEKADIVPADGVIFAEKKVSFYEGESVFDLLFREMKKNKIHMEFVNTPIYNSAYIEGIANLYEFDCGELSGWMYKVNGWFPNYGCSRYQLKDGDKVEWVYTCDLGSDVGGGYSARGGS